MALLTKGNMKYDHYSWTAINGDNPTITGIPDSTMFNRREGYEVLYLINKLMSIWDLKKLSSAHKMETMIKEKLPSDVRSQKNVKRWIYDNWENN